MHYHGPGFGCVFGAGLLGVSIVSFFVLIRSWYARCLCCAVKFVPVVFSRSLHGIWYTLARPLACCVLGLDHVLYNNSFVLICIPPPTSLEGMDRDWLARIARGLL